MPLETTGTAERTEPEKLSDEEIVERVRGGETALYELLMRRYNQRVYRIARSISGDESEAEDIMQEAYVRAYTHLSQFAGRAKFSTWLTKIAVYEALARRRQRSRMGELDFANRAAPEDSSPERQLLDAELRRRLEAAMDALPEQYRAILVMRDIEQMNTRETAEALGVSLLAAKVRLHRARAALRRELMEDVSGVAASAFSFHASRCDRVVANVLAAITQNR